MQAQIQDVLQQSPKPPAFLSQPWAQDGNRAVKDSGFRVEVPLFSIGNKQNGVERIVGDSAFTPNTPTRYGTPPPMPSVQSSSRPSTARKTVASGNQKPETRSQKSEVIKTNV
jgi:hypothetical protein